jgi:predicted short-subunit dehydrogenase-like oxidoreductase (DUF2520 family)
MYNVRNVAVTQAFGLRSQEDIKMRIGFIGAGKVGFTLGRYFRDNGLDVSGYYCRNIQSSTEAARFTRTKVFAEPEELVSESDVIFFAVPDEAVRTTYYSIRGAGLSGKQLCHCSGSMSAAEAFPEAKKYGASCCTLEPLYPISSKYDSFKNLSKAFFCIEGDSNCAREWQERLEKMGNRTKLIAASDKNSYSAACTLFSDLVCAVAGESISLMEKFGFTEKEALTAFEPIVMSRIKNIFALGPSRVLNGPVQTGDAVTVRKHIKSFDTGTDRDFYKAVERKVLEITEKKHTDKDYSEMRRILR